MPRIRRIVQSDEEDEDSPEKTIVTKDSVDIASDEEEWNGETEPLTKSKLATPVIRAHDTNERPKRAAAVSANKYIKAMVEEYTASSSHSKNASPRRTLKNTSTPSKMRILDSDTDEGSKSSSSVEEVVSPQLHSRSSGRSGTLSARKAANRENTILEYEKLSKGGLSAVLVDDSDEEHDRNTSKYNKKNQNKNDDDDYADDDEESDEDRYGVMKPLASSFFDKRKKKPTTITTTTSSITKTARPSSYEAKEEYYDYVDSDMDDFIVDDDEQEDQFIVDEEDDDHTYKKKKRKDKVKSYTKNRTSTPSSSTKMSNVDTTMTPTAKSSSSSSSSSSSVQKEVAISKARRSPRIIDDDDDDDDGDDNDEKKNFNKQALDHSIVNSSSSASTRSLAQDTLIKSTPNKPIVKSDYSEEESDESNAQEENDDDDDDSEEENEENDSDSDGDSPLAHWQVNAMLDQQREMSSMNNNAMRKNFSKEEAMQLYIEMMAKTLLEPSFLAQMQQYPYEDDHQLYIAASRQIENRLCTNRESLLGSGAWRQEFVNELQYRPFYMCTETKHSGDERCSICNRQSQNANLKIHLFGTRYDAKKMYDSSRWDKLLPPELLSDWKIDSSSSHKKKRKTQNIRGKASRHHHHHHHHHNNEDEDDIIVLSGDDEDDSVNNNDNNNITSFHDMDSDESIIVDDDDSNDSNEEEEEEECETAHGIWSKLMKQWPSVMTKGGESTWPAAAHCRNRTQMYHTLLNYKLRLLLKVREWLIRKQKENKYVFDNASDSHNSSSSSHTNKRKLMRELSAYDISNDTTFISQECNRLEAILSLAGSKWGSKDDYYRPTDFWKDTSTAREDDKPYYRHKPSTSSSSSSSGGGITMLEDAPKRTVLDWLKKPTPTTNI